MNRKISLIVILVLYIAVGIAGLIYLIMHGTITKPEKSTIESTKVSVSKLEAPKQNSDDGPGFDEVDTYDDFFTDNSSEELTSIAEEFPEEVASADELFSDDIPSEEAPDTTQAYTFVATHDKGRLFIRDMPSMDGKIIGHMYRGQKGDVVKDGDEWIYATYKNVTGYISKQYVELIPVE